MNWGMWFYLVMVVLVNIYIFVWIFFGWFVYYCEVVFIKLLI